MVEMEKKGLFKENSRDKNGKNIKFFNSGKAGIWKEKKLNKEIIENIEQEFYTEMLELKYI